MSYRNMICFPHMIEPDPTRPDSYIFQSTPSAFPNFHPSNQFTYVPNCHPMPAVPTGGFCGYIPAPPHILCPAGPTLPVAPVCTNQMVTPGADESAERASEKSKEEPEEQEQEHGFTVTVPAAAYLPAAESQMVLPDGTVFSPPEYQGNLNLNGRGRIGNSVGLQSPQLVQHAGSYMFPAYVSQPFQSAGSNSWITDSGAQWDYMNPMNSLPGGGPYPYFHHHQNGVQGVPAHHQPQPQMQPPNVYTPHHHPIGNPPHGSVVGHPTGVVRLGPRIPSFLNLPEHAVRPTRHFNLIPASPDFNRAGVRIIPSEHSAFVEISRLYETGNVIDDEHRDLRLDIDGMTYEELLALEERMGDVNTGLGEDFIFKNLKTHCFVKGNNASFQSATLDEHCTICQVEYEPKERIGTLDCGHNYHADCIKQWLLLKNLCPICKKTALSTDNLNQNNNNNNNKSRRDG